MHFKKVSITLASVFALFVIMFISTNADASVRKNVSVTVDQTTNLQAIAKEYQTKVSTLKEINHIDSDVLSQGMTLTVPEKPTFKVNNVAKNGLSNHLSGSNAAAKAWIAMRESGGSYSARNGACYGKYQISIGLFGGNYSPKHQEVVANHYVASRYGSWVNAKQFWLTHHWY
ncbi:LysM peptidoglycan-binding domain-containing protein [Apilactobacillus sp. TMW 2.2459]|nr:LysM peptidoglycan-binding domain-containing protein [Apilactobacillus xinyiensis]MCL0312620.1 LysM peptidoglycan-binding domain-containing protein [Apilactobacillus xinyiensis]MCL0330249.1 LysM peptidoglycan-binding domain-containing protein [Apilactobacillus xinyiensis]